MIQMIEVRKLVPHETNVRKKRNEADIDRLAASLKNHGLIQNLVVIELGGGDCYGVVAGESRRQAIAKLVSAGEWPCTYQVPCEVVGFDEARELSLVENVVRAPMSTAERVKAYADLAKAGMDARAIASRFSHPIEQVRRTLACGQLPDPIVTAWEIGDLSDEQIYAFTSGTHERAIDVFRSLDEKHKGVFSGWECGPRRIRDLMNESKIELRTRHEFAIEEYKAAGGTITSDLFETTQWIDDPQLYRTEMLSKLVKIGSDMIHDDGWKWMRPVEDSGWIARDALRNGGYRQMKPDVEVVVTEAEIDEYERLSELEDESAIDEAGAARLAYLQEKMDMPPSYSPGLRALGGILLSVDQSGNVEVDEGWVDPADIDAAIEAGGLSPDTKPAKKNEDGEAEIAAGLNRAFTDDMRTIRLLALAHHLEKQPELMLDILFDALFAAKGSMPWCKPLDIHLTRFHVSDVVMGSGIDPIDQPEPSPSTKAQRNRAIAQMLATVVNEQTLQFAPDLDIRKYWTPNSRFLTRYNKEQLIEISIEIGAHNDLNWRDMKKGDMVEKMAAIFAGDKKLSVNGVAGAKAWLPKPLRVNVDQEEAA